MNRKDTGARPGVRMVRVDPEHAGQRIDNYLLRELKGAPRSLIYRLLRRGEVRVNRGRVRAVYRLQSGDEVRIPPLRLAAEGGPGAPEGGLGWLAGRVLYEDAQLLVLDKPAGLAVHGGSGVAWGLIEALRTWRAAEQGQNYELVHRLDRETSGCILVAKRRSALRRLHRSWHSDEVEKIYLALVQGRWPRRLSRVEAPLRKNRLSGGERVVRVDPEGQAALTRFTPRQAWDGATLVEALLGSGRTHQIRVHCAHAGHPIAGDDRYGSADFNRAMRELGLRRLFLHACELAFRDAEGTTVRVRAPLDPALQALLQRLDAGAAGNRDQAPGSLRA